MFDAVNIPFSFIKYTRRRIRNKGNSCNSSLERCIFSCSARRDRHTSKQIFVKLLKLALKYIKVMFSRSDQGHIAIRECNADFLRSILTWIMADVNHVIKVPITKYSSK